MFPTPKYKTQTLAEKERKRWTQLWSVPLLVLCTMVFSLVLGPSVVFAQVTTSTMDGGGCSEEPWEYVDTLTWTVGDILQFEYEFITNEGAGTYNDEGGFRLQNGPPKIRVICVNDLAVAPGTSGVTVYQYTLTTSGSGDLDIYAENVGDCGVESIFTVDNAQILPQPPLISIDDVVALEGTTATFTISLNKVAGSDVDVTYQTTDGTATAPGDYGAKSDTITIPAGNTEWTIDVDVYNDGPGDDGEVFYVDLIGSSGPASLDDSRGEGFIKESNNPPTAADNTVTTDEDTVYTFAAGEFNFFDLDPGDTLRKIQVTGLETAGDLELNFADVILNQEIAVSDIANLTFTPASNANGLSYASFKFLVHDGTVYSDPLSPYTMGINVTALNDPPEILHNHFILVRQMPAPGLRLNRHCFPDQPIA